MESDERAASGYVVPRYRAGGDPAWYHVLHGTVPGHQIDFMYCPDVPQGSLNQGHLGHLSRLIKYIEPRDAAPYAFAIGNLSRDDIQHEPGHGGVAVMFALRVAGVTDHAGRAMPPYAHGVLAIDRELDYTALLEAISVFYRRFLVHDPRDEDATGSFYRAYWRTVQERPEAVEDFLRDYVGDFDELPQPPRSTLGFEWEADEEMLPKRITIVHADDEPFASIAHAAANIAAMLYKSNIKWTSITSGREIEIPGGVPIRFVPASEATRDVRQTLPRKTGMQDFRAMAARDPKGLQVNLQDLPSEEKALAHLLFGARPRNTETKAPRANWREALGVAKADDASATGSHAVPVRHPSTRPPRDVAQGAKSNTESADASFDEAPTLQAPLEPAPVAAAAPGAAAAAAAGVGAAAFDPRQSSSTKGMASAFDPRRSSPMTGMAVAAPAGGLPRVVPTPEVSAPVRPPVTPTPAADSNPPPSMEMGSLDAGSSEPLPQMRPRVGVWIGVIGGLAVIVAIAVAVATSDDGASESAMETGGTAPGAGVTSTAPAMSSAPTVRSSAAVPEPTLKTSGVTTPGPSSTTTTKATTVPPKPTATPGKKPSIKVFHE